MEEAKMEPPRSVKTVLHVGCGPYAPEFLPDMFRTAEWHEVRLDIDPGVKPDILASITDLSAVASDSMDALWSAHNLEHIYAHEVPVALKEFQRVLRPGGFALLTMPDLQQVAARVAQGLLEETVCQTPAGPITPLDILYGYRPDLAAGNHYMAHKTGFTARSLAQKLQTAGFQKIQVQQDQSFNLWATAYK